MNQRNISQALFEALAWGGMTAKELSQTAGVTEAQISRFRKGGDIYSSVVQRLIDGLPDRIYNKFLLVLDGYQAPKNTDVQIADQILDLAYQLKKNRATKKNQELVLNGSRDK